MSAVTESFVHEKRHADVLRDIGNLLKSLPDAKLRSAFIETSYLDENGQSRPSFDLTRQGFTLLVMGWTGGQWLMRSARSLDIPCGADQFCAVMSDADLLPLYLSVAIDHAMAAQAAAEDRDIPAVRAAIEAMTLPLVEAGKIVGERQVSQFVPAPGGE